MSLNRLLILGVIVLVGGCSDARDSRSAAGLPDNSLPGVYTGTFPCDDCSGIEATLWLRPDRRFFFRQQYPGENGLRAMSAYNLGRWSWIQSDRVIVLMGAGPRRTFARRDPDTLVMQTESDLEHRLTRDPTAPDFSARIRMDGIMRMRGDRASFTECLTGLVVPVDKGRDFGRFLHQYRSVGALGEPVHVELEGRFYWSGDGTMKSLTIERFITIKSSGSC